MSETNSDEFVEETPDLENVQETDPLSHDDELQQYGEGVRKRIAELTAKAREAERIAQEAVEQRETVVNVARNLAEENKALKANRGEADKAILENLEEAVGGKLSEAKRKLRDAHNEADPDKIAEATAEVAALAADHRRVQLAKAGYRPPTDEPQQPAPPVRQAPQVHPKASAWMARNADWYGKDEAKTRKALAADRYLTTAGFDQSSDDYYKELDRMVSGRVSNVSDAPNRDQGRPHQPVTPSGRTDQPRSPGNKVALSASEVAMAKRLGISPDAYAAAKKSGSVSL